MFYAFPISYHEPVYRPPSEANSLLLQVTLGCSWNACGYCAMYKNKRYRERSLQDIERDIRKASEFFATNGAFATRKVFLCDGDALAAPFPLLKDTLDLINKHLTATVRVGIYASARNILSKSKEELSALSAQKLKVVYLGAESGCDSVLSLINKGNTASEIAAACLKLKECGIKLSMILMTGLGGRELSGSHCRNSAELVNMTSPDFLSFLTTTPVPGTQYARLIQDRKVTPLTIRELLYEMRTVLSGINNPAGRIIFRSNHASNLLPLEGILPRDTEKLCGVIDRWIEECPEGVYPEQDPSML